MRRKNKKFFPQKRKKTNYSVCRPSRCKKESRSFGSQEGGEVGGKKEKKGETRYRIDGLRPGKKGDGLIIFAVCNDRR